MPLLFSNPPPKVMLLPPTLTEFSTIALAAAPTAVDGTILFVVVEPKFNPKIAR